MKEILKIINKTIYQFFDVYEDDEEASISDKDKLLLEVNKAICNNLKALEQDSVLNKIKEEIKDNTYYINEITEKEGIDFETVEKIIDKYTGRADTAIKAIEQTKWIPVSERLPEDEEYVLVCYSNGDIRAAYYYIDTKIYPSEFEDCCETGWYDYNEDFMYNQDVVAWMPLPEPYKEESDGV